MKFTEEKAAELAEKFKLPKAHINKWRFNDRIPDKYEDKKDTRVVDRETEILRKKLSSDKINITSLSLYTGLKRPFVEKFIAGNYSYSESELIEIKKLLSEIKIEIRKLLDIVDKFPLITPTSEKEIKRILDLKYFYLKNVISPEVAGKISKWKNGNRVDFPIEDKKEIQSKLYIFITEI